MKFAQIRNRVDLERAVRRVVVSNEVFTDLTGRVLVMPLLRTEQVSPGIGFDFEGKPHYIAFAMVESVSVAALDDEVRGLADVGACVEAVSMLHGGMRP